MGGVSRYVILLCILSAVMAATAGLSRVSAAESPFAVQLRTMGLQAVSEAGHRGRTVATVYIEVPDQRGFVLLCRNLPRVLDAILLNFEQAPMFVSQRAAVLTDRQLELGALIERSAGEGTFRRMHIVTGSRQRGEGTTVLAIDGGSRDCQPIRNIPWQNETPPDAAQVINAFEGERAALRAAALAEQSDTEAADDGGFQISVAWIWIIALMAIGGFAMIGIAVFLKKSGKRRKDRRAKERRARERRAQDDRRAGGTKPSGSSERRAGGERRKGASRRSGRRRLRDRLAPSTV